MATDLVDVIADEMAAGVDRAVECWMSQIEQALTDVNLTSLGRLNAVREVLDDYKALDRQSATARAKVRRKGPAAKSLLGRLFLWEVRPWMLIFLFLPN